MSLLAGALALDAASNIVNTGLQFHNMQYQKGMQQQIFNREDSSIRRRVKDLQRAGLSPVLAAGQGANAGPVIQTQAPQIDTKSNLTQNAMNLMKMKADIAQTVAQKDYIDMQREKSRVETVGQQIENAINSKDYKKYVDSGINPRNQSGLTKPFTDIFGIKESPIASPVVKELHNKVKTDSKSFIKKLDDFFKPAGDKRPYISPYKKNQK